jgi:hypothetical protein
MTSRRDGDFKLKATPVSSSLPVCGKGRRAVKAARWQVRELADDLYRLRARFDLMATRGALPRTT